MLSRPEPFRGAFAALLLAASAIAQAPVQGDVRLEGRVADALGAPVPVTEVWAECNGREVGRVRCDGLGCFVMPRLPRDLVRLRCKAEGYVGPCQVLDLDTPIRERFLEVRMLDACLIRGTVTDVHGKALAGARVLSIWKEGRQNGSIDDSFVTTDVRGNFELPAAVGDHVVHVLAAGHAPGSAQVSVHDPVRISIAVPAAESCRVRVHFDGATPEQLGGTRFCWKGDKASVTPCSEVLGRYWPRAWHGAEIEFLGVPIGCGIRSICVSEVSGSVTPCDYPLPAAPGESTVRAVLEPWHKFRTVELRGRVVDVEGRAVPDCGFSTRIEPRSRFEARSAADGAFVLALPSVGTTAYLSLERDDYVAVSPRFDSWDGFHVALPTGDVELVLERAAVITGRLVDPSGRPLFGAKVGLSRTRSPNERLEIAASTFTRRDGTFVLRRLRATDDAWLRITGPDANHVQGGITLVPGQSLALGEIQVAPACIIQGTLVDAGGEPMRVRAVNLLRSDDEAVFEEWHKTFTDRAGRFRFLGLSEGRYLISPGAPRRLAPVAVVTVAKGERKTALGEDW